MNVSKGGVVERIARVLVGQRLSSNADGNNSHAAADVDAAWRTHVDDAIAVLRTMREPDARMADAGDPVVWEKMILAALPESAR